MRKVQFQVSSKKTITVELPQKVEIWFLYLLRGLTFLAGATFLFLFARGLVTETYSTISFLKLTTIAVVVLAAIRFMMLLFGGAGFFPESKFDLPSLLLAIALISTLLTKQLFDLERSEGMLSNDRYWYIAIFGTLLLLLVAYFVDIISRNEKVRRYLIFSLIGLVEVLTFLYWLFGQEVLALSAVSLLALTPLIYVSIFTLKNFYTKWTAVVGLLFALLAGMLNLDSEINFLFFVVILLYGGLLLWRQRIGRQALLKIKDEVVSRKLRFNKIEKEVFTLGLVIPSLKYVLVYIVLLALGKQELAMLKEGLEANWNAITNADSQTLFIGGRLEYANSSYFSNFFSSFGSLGVVFLVMFFGYVIYVALINLKGFWKKLEIENYMLAALLVSVSFIVAFAFFLNITAGLWILLFVLISQIASYTTSAKEVKLKALDLSFIKDERFRKTLLVLRYILVVAVFIIGAYTVFNVEEVLVSL